jgi:hypothetical protein
MTALQMDLFDERNLFELSIPTSPAAADRLPQSMLARRRAHKRARLDRRHHRRTRKVQAGRARR